MKYYCQSCGMNMTEEKDFGRNADGSKNTDYCTYCYQNGSFTMDCTMEQMIEHNLKFLDEFNKGAGTTLNKTQAKEEMQKYFPSLKRWKK